MPGEGKDADMIGTSITVNDALDVRPDHLDSCHSETRRMNMQTLTVGVLQQRTQGHGRLETHGHLRVAHAREDARHHSRDASLRHHLLVGKALDDAVGLPTGHTSTSCIVMSARTLIC